MTDRIAAFDNDGTLWIEQPMYAEFAFAIDRVKALAPKHPEGKEEQPFRATLQRDTATVGASGEQGLVALMMATHAGMTPDDFRQIVNEWIAAARQRRFHRHYTGPFKGPLCICLEGLR